MLIKESVNYWQLHLLPALWYLVNYPAHHRTYKPINLHTQAFYSLIIERNKSVFINKDQKGFSKTSWFPGKYISVFSGALLCFGAATDEAHRLPGVGVDPRSGFVFCSEHAHVHHTLTD